MGARVTGIDVSAPMLARARQRAPAVEFIQADASTQRFERGFDVLFSRFGVMFFADPDAAFAHLRRALRPAGRLAFLCWRDWRDNEWVRVPITAVRPHLPPQPQSGPEEPGPFAFADPARVRRILTAGGFAGIAMRPFDADLVLGATLDEAVDHLRAFGPVARALADATDTEKTAAVAALRGALQPCAARRPFTLSGAMWIVNAQI
jgi:SAM-dependent methyltransferase